MLGDITVGEDLIKLQQLMQLKQADVVMSDIAPEMTGEKGYDSFHVTNLNNHVVSAANRILKPGGNLLMKTFQGPDEAGNFAFFKLLFKEFHRIKPHASRKRSPELYYLGKGFKMTDFYKELSSLNSSKITFNKFYDMFPAEYTRTKEEFRLKLIHQSKHLQETGIELIPGTKKILKVILGEDYNANIEIEEPKKPNTLNKFLKFRKEMLKEKDPAAVYKNLPPQEGLFEESPFKEKQAELNKKAKKISENLDFRILNFEEELKRAREGVAMKDEQDEEVFEQMEKNLMAKKGLLQSREDIVPLGAESNLVGFTYFQFDSDDNRSFIAAQRRKIFERDLNKNPNNIADNDPSKQPIPFEEELLKSAEFSEGDDDDIDQESRRELKLQRIREDYYRNVVLMNDAEEGEPDPLPKMEAKQRAKQRKNKSARFTPKSSYSKQMKDKREEWIKNEMYWKK